MMYVFTLQHRDKEQRAEQLANTQLTEQRPFFFLVLQSHSRKQQDL
jgi:hypothetical protein